eukprot:CAMPEP_0168367646 /NCGR_PEP_ID=MMETSP0228-20121227/5846_1 /TAXON_ID=133427 /ORGANISM="Protoceratium reticulatum, Strain CCCM 535 (=CCMP 1889)" /LENGTH=180 /DNA_ID=CAMNT_0008380475 /DNA_START=16 /DNA_END=554 /DNA_ORIENTATION=-
MARGNFSPLQSIMKTAPTQTRPPDAAPALWSPRGLWALIKLIRAEFLNARQVFDKTRRGDFKEAMALLEESPVLWREADAEGGTLLHWASLGGFAPMVQQGISSGAVVDAVAHNGQTPMMWSIIMGHVPTARMLLEAKADPHASDSMGATPFILAIQHQQHAALLMLISMEPRERLLGVT